MKTIQALEKEFYSLLNEFSPQERKLIKKAFTFAKEHHREQIRLEGLPYIVHPLRIAITLLKRFGIKKTDLICVALLHDLVEDTSVKLKEIENLFGKKIRKGVAFLTRQKKKDENEKNIYQRKYRHFRKLLKKAPKEICLIKAVDLLDNMNSWPRIPLDHPARFRFPRWIKETKTMLLPLAKSIDPQLEKEVKKEFIQVLKKIRSQKRRIHFIGIGGIGVSALARFYLLKGEEVSGSDLVSSEITEDLKKLGARIFIGKHKETNLKKNTDLVIYSNAVLPSNPELKKAKKLKIKCLSYPQALGELTKHYFTIAVCGAHGKGTTTAIASLVLIKAGFNPTVIIGTNLKEFNNSNCYLPKTYSPFLIIEADEYRRAFLNYWPKIIILTNIDREHLDYYKNINDIKSAFKDFVRHLPKDGILIANRDNQYVRACHFEKIRKTVFYSLKQRKTKEIKKVIALPGKHNLSNALAVLTLAKILKIPQKICFSVFRSYQGAWRRFEIFKTKIKTNTKEVPFVLISDYAHHPNEIKATLEATREKFGSRKIWAVFQPHQYQRTYYLFKDFASAFEKANRVILLPVYSVAGREKKEIIRKVDLSLLVKGINKKEKKAQLVSGFKEAKEVLKKELKPGEVVVVMGAGDVYYLVLELRAMK